MNVNSIDAFNKYALKCGLNQREVFIVLMRLEREGKKTMTLQQIGTHYGITRERVRQIEAKAFRKLRGKLDFCHPGFYDLIVATDPFKANRKEPR